MPPVCPFLHLNAMMTLLEARTTLLSEELLGVKGIEKYVLCVCAVIPFILDVRLLVDAPAEVAQEEGHKGFLPLPSAALALIFIATGFSHPFPSSTVKKSNSCIHELIVLHLLNTPEY